MFKYLSVSGFILSSIVFSTAVADVPTMTLDQILAEAINKKKTYLPEFLRESVARCELHLTPSNLGRSCLEEVREQTFSILTCESTLSRWQEMGALDDHDMDAMLESYPSTDVPPDIKTVFEELVNIAARQWRNTPAVQKFPLPQWSIEAYAADYYNAHAGANGSILISSQFWQTASPFSVDEIRAILAHEVAHVLLNHSLELGCLYFEWSNQPSTASLLDAREIIHGDFSVTMGAGKAWSELSQKNEFRADAMAVELLYNLHYDGLAMARAIQKIYDHSPKGGFSSGSHPDLLDRVEEARRKATTYGPPRTLKNSLSKIASAGLTRKS